MQTSMSLNYEPSSEPLHKAPPPVAPTSAESSELFLLRKKMEKRNSSRTCLVQTFGRAGIYLGRDGLRRPFPAGIGWVLPPPPPEPRTALRGGISKSMFPGLSTFDNDSQQNGSKNGKTAPRPGTGYPHEGPSMECPFATATPHVPLPDATLDL